MDSTTIPETDCGPGTASPKVQELIYQLQSSFFSVQFQNVAKTLIEREEQMHEKYIKLGKKSEAVQKEKDLLFLENRKLKDELQKHHNEVDELRKVNLENKDKIRVLNLGKRKASKNLSLENELKKKQSEIDEVRKTNVDHERTISDLKSEKRRMEAEIRAYEQRLSELHPRVSILEKKSKALMDSGGTVRIKVENQQQKNASASESRKTPLFREVEGLNRKTEPKFHDIIQTDDDDDDDGQKQIFTSKRKRVPKEIKKEHTGDDDVDKNMPTGTHKRKNLQELHNQPKSSPLVSTPHSADTRPPLEKHNLQNPRSSFYSSDSSSDSDKDDINKPYKMILASMKSRKERWGVETDLHEELDKDNELCMNAICALYRQRVQWKSMSFGIDIIPAQDLSRIARLAKLLIDGDPRENLKKKPSELNRLDLDECRKFAKKHSGPLFFLYKKKKDPFFPPSRS